MCQIVNVTDNKKVNLFFLFRNEHTHKEMEIGFNTKAHHNTFS